MAATPCLTEGLTSTISRLMVLSNTTELHTIHPTYHAGRKPRKVRKCAEERVLSFIDMYTDTFGESMPNRKATHLYPGNKVKIELNVVHSPQKVIAFHMISLTRMNRVVS